MLGKVDTVILGLLSDEARHGYDIVKEYHRRAMDGWVGVGDASIYQALPRLERAGLIEAAPVSRRAKRKVYRLTGAGRKRFREAILERLSSNKPCELDLNIGIGFIESLKKDEVIAALDGRHAYLMNVMRSMGEIKSAPRHGERSLPHDMIALQRLKLAEAELEWIDRVVEWLGGPVGGRR